MNNAGSSIQQRDHGAKASPNDRTHKGVCVSVPKGCSPELYHCLQPYGGLVHRCTSPETRATKTVHVHARSLTDTDTHRGLTTVALVVVAGVT